MRTLALPSLFLALGCVGVVSGPDRDGAQPAPGPGSGLSGSGSGGSAMVVPPGSVAFSPAPGAVLRLTNSQYRQTLRMIFGDQVPLPDKLEQDLQLAGYTTVGASVASFSTPSVEQLAASAEAIAAYAFGEGGALRSTVDCAVADGPDAACAEATLSGLAERLFRRPLRPGEVETYLGVFQVATNLGETGWRGLEAAVSALVQSSKFLFRVERGEPTADDASQRAYTSTEMASRIAFAVTGRGPDEALYRAGLDGRLASAEGIKEAVRALVGSEGARSTALAFFGEYLDLDRVELMAKDQTAFPAFNPGLPLWMRQETERTIAEVALGAQGNALSLIDTRTTFVNAELGALYGLTGVSGTGLTAVELPEESVRRGILGQASFLASKAHQRTSSPTLRGKFVRERLLCMSIRGAPADVPALPEDPAGELTTRQKLEAHREQPQCAACHSLMDPIGVAFENYDALGVYRDVEGGQPIDASGELDGKPFQDVRGLISALREDERVPRCIMRQYFRYTTAHVETPGEEPVLSDLERRFAQSEYSLEALLPELLASDSFRFTREAL